MATNAQTAANRENAQLSTGPTSATGKSISSRNAEDLGIFKRQFNLMPNESPAEFNALSRAYHKDLRPDGAAEASLVDTMVMLQWEIYRFERAQPIVIARAIAESGKDPDEAYVDLLMQPRNNTLKYLLQRRDRAQNQWFRALKELQRLQKARNYQPKPPAPETEEIGFVAETPLETPKTADPTPSISPDKVV